MVKQEKCLGAKAPTGSVATAAGSLDGAIAAYREAIRLRPDFLQAHRHLRNALRAKGDVQGALESCRQILRMAPGDAEALRVLHELAAEEVTGLLNRAGALAADGNMDAAAAAFREVIRLRPSCAEAHNGLGALLVIRREFAEAAERCSEAIRLRPDYADAHFNLGNALAAASAAQPAPTPVRTEVAPPRENRMPVPPASQVPSIAAPAELGLDDVETRTQDQPVRKASCAQSGYRRAIREGNTLAERGDLDGAIARYREAVRLRPDVPEAHNNLGVALRRKGDFDGAVAAFQAAVRLKPEAAEAHNNLAVALRSKGDFPSAIVSSREAVRLRPDLAPAWYNLACAYAMAGDARQAAEGLRQAIGLDVKFRELARREADLRKVRRSKEVVTYLGKPEK